MLDDPDNKNAGLSLLLRVAVASLPTIGAVLIGMYVQTQQVLAALTTLDRDVTALKTEVAQIRKEYVSREELTRTIELITAKRGK
jgi:hypothetical protein